MRIWAHIAVLIGSGSILAACSGSPPLSSVSPVGLTRQQSVERQAYHILYKFGGKGDGAKPSAPLINVKGTLYGTTANGGSHHVGTVFAITKSGEETVLHSFGGSGDGAQPFAGLTDVDGTFSARRAQAAHITMVPSSASRPMVWKKCCTVSTASYQTEGIPTRAWST